VAENEGDNRSTEMTGWNEDNFLERLLAQVRQKRGAERGPCPDAETLLAVLEGEASAPLREQVTEHLRQCPDCAELQSRLLNFEAGASPEPEAVWKERRKRLDNWLEGFLISEAAKPRAARSAGPSTRSPLWEALRSFFFSPKVAWAVGVVALLVLITDGVLVMEVRRGRPPQIQVAARATVPQKQPTNAQPPEKPVVEAPLVGARAKQERGLPQVAGRLPSKQQAPYGQGGGASGGQAAAPLPSSPPLNAAAAPATEPAPSLRLEPGAHLLIALSSVNRLPNGTFQFRGTLLPPVPQAGPVSLDRGAEVIGAGTMSQGQTSLAITEFLVQGGRYTLKVGNGAMKVQAPGAGAAVQLDRGQILEMWPASPSVYEKAPDTTPQPEPQKGSALP
jgi:hypothetical protein